MKLVMTIVVRDEEDIIGLNIEHHLSIGVDKFIVLDNGSVDGTTCILKEYAAKGVVDYLHNASGEFLQGQWMTNLARLAFNKYSADWVINNDADEFWIPVRHRSFGAAFGAVSGEVGTLMALRYTFPPVYGAGWPLSRMIYRFREPRGLQGSRNYPKMAHRGSACAIVDDGNHRVLNGVGGSVAEGIVKIYHYPVRTREQYLRKKQRAMTMIARRNPEKYGRLCKKMEKEPDLWNREYDAIVLTRSDVLIGLVSRKLVKDCMIRRISFDYCQTTPRVTQ